MNDTSDLKIPSFERLESLLSGAMTGVVSRTRAGVEQLSAEQAHARLVELQANRRTARRRLGSVLYVGEPARTGPKLSTIRSYDPEAKDHRRVAAALEVRAFDVDFAEQRVAWTSVQSGLRGDTVHVVIAALDAEGTGESPILHRFRATEAKQGRARMREVLSRRQTFMQAAETRLRTQHADAFATAQGQRFTSRDSGGSREDGGSWGGGGGSSSWGGGDSGWTGGSSGWTGDSGGGGGAAASGGSWIEKLGTSGLPSFGRLVQDVGYGEAWRASSWRSSPWARAEKEDEDRTDPVEAMQGTSVAIDAKAGFVFWLEFVVSAADDQLEGRYRIVRARLDGSERKVIVGPLAPDVREIVLDRNARRLYWVRSKRVSRCDYEGENRGPVGPPAPEGVSIDDIYLDDEDRYLYMTRHDPGRAVEVVRVGLSGAQVPGPKTLASFEHPEVVSIEVERPGTLKVWALGDVVKLVHPTKSGLVARPLSDVTKVETLLDRPCPRGWYLVSWYDVQLADLREASAARDRAIEKAATAEQRARNEMEAKLGKLEREVAANEKQAAKLLAEAEKPEELLAKTQGETTQAELAYKHTVKEAEAFERKLATEDVAYESEQRATAQAERDKREGAKHAEAKALSDEIEEDEAEIARLEARIRKAEVLMSELDKSD